MNKVVLMGRLTKEPEVRRTTEDKAVARFTVAINRRGNNEETDFINCVAFGKTANRKGREEIPCHAQSLNLSVIRNVPFPFFKAITSE